MSEMFINQVHGAGDPVEHSIEKAQKTAPTGRNIEAAASSNVSSSTSIRTMDDLKKVAPEFEEAMVKMLAWGICTKMKQSQERIKKINREAQR